MVTFYTLFPELLNLNGDQANVFVLQKRLAWQGESSEIVSINNDQDLDRFAAMLESRINEVFLLIGHGSTAAMNVIEPLAPRLRELIFGAASMGLNGLAIGSGYELLYPDFVRGERVSDYASIEASEGLPAMYGYVNTDTNLPHASVLGENFVCTMVHGPVLARSPELADRMLERLGVALLPSSESLEADSYALKSRAH